MDDRCGWTFGDLRCRKSAGHEGFHTAYEFDGRWRHPLERGLEEIGAVPAGWASTDDEVTGLGEVREKATLKDDGRATAAYRGTAEISWHRAPGNRAFLRDLVTAHNAYFNTDPEEDRKLDAALKEVFAERRGAALARAVHEILEVTAAAAHPFCSLIFHDKSHRDAFIEKAITRILNSAFDSL